MKQITKIVLAFLFVGILFNGCSENKKTPEVTTEKKETEKKEPEQKYKEYVAPEGGISAAGVKIDGYTTTVDGSVMRNTLTNFDPNSPVYYPCGEVINEFGDLSGNGYMNSGMEGVWENYKYTYDAITDKYSFTQNKELGAPLMGTACQVVNVGGQKRIRWMAMGPFLGSKILYDNRPGPNKRVAFCGPGYQPELHMGLVIPLNFTTDGRPYPGNGKPTAVINEDSRLLPNR